MKENKKLSLLQLVAIAAGQVIGAGVITTTGLAVGETGRSAFLAYGLAVLLGTIWIYPIMYFASMAKYKGGSYTVVTATLGDLWGGIYALWWTMLLFSTAMFGMSIGQYVHALIPAIPARAAAIVTVVLFFATNLLGVNIMAKVQTFMATFLVVALAIFVVAGLTKCNFAEPLDQTAFFMNGGEGFMSALILLIYSTSGHNLVATHSYAAKNPKKNIPMAMLITTGIIFVLYVGISFVDAYVLPIEQVAGQSLVNVSKEIFPAWLFYLFIIGGPIMALMTTLNSSFSAYTAPTVAAINRGWLPKSFGKKNRHGVPYLVYSFMFVLALIPILFGVSLKAITNYTVMAQRVCMSLVCFCGFYYPTRFKKQWEASWLHMPKIPYYIFMTVCFVTQLSAVFISGRKLSTPLFIGNMMLLIVLVVYAFFRFRSGKTTAATLVYTFDDNEEIEA